MQDAKRLSVSGSVGAGQARRPQKCLRVEVVMLCRLKSPLIHDLRPLEWKWLGKREVRIKEVKEKEKSNKDRILNRVGWIEEIMKSKQMLHSACTHLTLLYELKCLQKKREVLKGCTLISIYLLPSTLTKQCGKESASSLCKWHFP